MIKWILRLWLGNDITVHYKMNWEPIDDICRDLIKETKIKCPWAKKITVNWNGVPVMGTVYN